MHDFIKKNIDSIREISSLQPWIPKALSQPTQNNEKIFERFFNHMDTIFPFQLNTNLFLVEALPFIHIG